VGAVREAMGLDTKLLLGVELADLTLAILGMGRIGQAIARRARGFGMPVLYHNRRRLDAAVEQELNARWCPFEDLLSDAGVLVVSCPLTANTRNLLDASRLALLRPTAVLVSITAGVVDEHALAAALESGALFSAAVDNYADEPNIPAALLRQERVVLSPHLGSATVQTRQAMEHSQSTTSSRYSRTHPR
jgi:glyoxylate reductase